MTGTTLSLAQARRIAVRAQLLDGSATSILDTVRRIGFLQLDPTARVAPSHLLVLWSRLGAYDRAELDRLLWQDRALFEWNAFVYPIEDLPLYLPRMKRFPSGSGAWQQRVRDWVEANAKLRRQVLRELERRGPLPSRELRFEASHAWPSSGWTGGRNVSQMLEFLMASGKVAVTGRSSGQRLWDLAERCYPPVEPLPEREAEAALAEKKLRSLGIARSGPGKRAVVEGVPGEWRVDPAAVAHAEEPLPRRTTLLSPFDRLIHDRDRAEALFGFRYRIEIYVPAAKREYGYFVLPVLYGDRLVGRIDPEHDGKASVFRVHRVFPEPGVRFPQAAADRAVRSLARFLGAGSVELPAGRVGRDRAASSTRRRSRRPS